MSRRHLLPHWTPLIMLVLAACASAPPMNRTIAIGSTAGGQYLPGANCSVTTYNGSWNVVTPASVPVPTAGDVSVVCDMAGYRRSEVIYRAPAAGVPGGSQLGIGVGGSSHGGVGIGLGLGLPIGAGPQPVYPSQLNVEMSPIR